MDGKLTTKHNEITDTSKNMNKEFFKINVERTDDGYELWMRYPKTDNAIKEVREKAKTKKERNSLMERFREMQRDLCLVAMSEFRINGIEVGEIWGVSHERVHQKFKDKYGCRLNDFKKLVEAGNRKQALAIFEEWDNETISLREYSAFFAPKFRIPLRDHYRSGIKKDCMGLDASEFLKDKFTWEKPVSDLIFEIYAAYPLLDKSIESYVMRMRELYAVRSKKKQRNIDWSKVNWELRNCEISDKYKIPNTISISTNRKRFAPQTVGVRGGGGFTHIDWSKVQWDKPISPQAKKLKIIPGVMYSRRKRLGLPLVAARKHTKIPVEKLKDKTISNMELFVEYPVCYSTVYKQRKKLETPVKKTKPKKKKTPIIKPETRTKFIDWEQVNWDQTDKRIAMEQGTTKQHVYIHRRRVKNGHY